MADMRDRLIDLLAEAETKVTEQLSRPLELEEWLGIYADHLLANGVILPPCKVGDTVYRLDDFVWDSECCHCEHYLVGGFGDPSACNKTLSGRKAAECIEIVENKVTYKDILGYLAFDDFGKTVFLTLEEAQEAHKERNNNEKR